MTRIVHLIVKELVHRRGNALLTVAAITAAVSISVALQILHDGSVRETRRIQRDIGFNLRIVPRDTDMQRFYLTGYSEQTFDEAAVAKLSANETLAYNHLVATLSQQIEVAPGVKAIVTGLGEPHYPPGSKRPPMVRPLQPGVVHVGAFVAAKLGIAVEDMLEVAGEAFSVARISPETGTVDDLRLLLNLTDAQRILGEAGRINEIKALDCLCVESAENPRALLQAEIQRVVPDAKVVMLTAIADARAKQRRTVEGLNSLVTPLVLLAAGVWVAALAMSNVRQRRTEIGVLRALGYRSRAIAGLFLGKALLLGLLGALVGYALGASVALMFGPDLFRMTARALNAQPMLGLYAIILAPLGAAVASFIPAALAVAHDPAVSLAND